MAGIDELAKADAVRMASDPYAHSELLSYLVGGVTSKTIRALVRLADLEPSNESTLSRTRSVRLRVLVDATLGLTVVDPMKDKVLVSLRVGEAAKWCRVTSIIESAGSYWWLSAVEHP